MKIRQNDKFRQTWIDNSYYLSIQRPWTTVSHRELQPVSRLPTGRLMIASWKLHCRKWCSVVASGCCKGAICRRQRITVKKQKQKTKQMPIFPQAARRWLCMLPARRMNEIFCRIWEIYHETRKKTFLFGIAKWCLFRAIMIR